eukprot:7389698-Prymnesium_polylepis.1
MCVVPSAHCCDGHRALGQSERVCGAVPVARPRAGSWVCTRRLVRAEPMLCAWVLERTYTPGSTSRPLLLYSTK